MKQQPSVFEIKRAPNGSLVHIRLRETGECIGDVEAALYDILRQEWEREQHIDGPRGGAL